MTPNILFLLADDLGWGDVGYHGAPIDTPNLDRLARGGVELDRHYVCPVCTPTRAALLSGRHPGRFGGHATHPTNAPVLPDGLLTLPGMLRGAGYRTGLFGKWHLGSAPEYFPGRYGFDASYGSLAGGVDPYLHRYKRGEFSRTWHRDGEPIDERGHVTDLITDAAVEWIGRDDRPWFCYLPFTAVHTPIRPPEAWLDRYAGRAFDDDPARDRSFRAYAAYASHMDAAVGRVVEALKCLDQLDNTLIIFASDNGAPTSNPARDTALYPGVYDDTPRLGSNAPLRGGKNTLYEGGIRTPAVVSWRNRLAARRLDAPLHIVDWMPTFAALLGLTPPADAGWDGANIWPLLAGERADPPERTLYWSLRGVETYAVRRGAWKLIVRHPGADETRELYHLDDDPLETRDHLGDAPKTAAALRAALDDHRRLDDTAVCAAMRTEG